MTSAAISFTLTPMTSYFPALAICAAALLPISPCHADAVDDTISALTAARQSYTTCARDNAVRLGAGNTETADTILRAVRSICATESASIKAAYDTIPFYPRDLYQRNILKDRTVAEDAAVAALLDARAGGRGR